MDYVLPRARKEGLIVKELSEEILIYDLQRHEASCLNQTAALVWKHCDGETSVAELARVLATELRTTVDEDLVGLALDQLEQYRLLQEPTCGLPAPSSSTRRALLKRGFAVAILPLIITISVPTAAQAASPGPTGPTGATGPTGPTGP